MVSVSHANSLGNQLRELLFQGYDYIDDRIGPASRTLRGASRDRMRARGELLGRRAAALRPVFLRTAEYLPNDAIRAEVAACLADMEKELGAPDAAEIAAGEQFRAAFDAEKARLAKDGEHVYLPGTRVARYTERPFRATGVPNIAARAPRAPRRAGVDVSLDRLHRGT